MSSSSDNIFTLSFAGISTECSNAVSDILESLSQPELLGWFVLNTNTSDLVIVDKDVQIEPLPNQVVARLGEAKHVGPDELLLTLPITEENVCAMLTEATARLTSPQPEAEAPPATARLQVKRMAKVAKPLPIEFDETDEFEPHPAYQQMHVEDVAAPVTPKSFEPQQPREAVPLPDPEEAVDISEHAREVSTPEAAPAPQPRPAPLKMTARLEMPAAPPTQARVAPPVEQIAPAGQPETRPNPPTSNGLSWSWDQPGVSPLAQKGGTPADAPSENLTLGDAWAEVAMVLYSIMQNSQPVIAEMSVAGTDTIQIDFRFRAFSTDVPIENLPCAPIRAAIRTVTAQPEWPPAFALPGQSLDKLLWFVGINAFSGAPAPWIKPEERYRLQRWPNFTEMSYRPEHMRMTALIGNAFLSPEEIALQARVPVETAVRMINAYSLMGLLQATVVPERASAFEDTHAYPPYDAAGPISRWLQKFGL